MKRASKHVLIGGSIAAAAAAVTAGVYRHVAHSLVKIALDREVKPGKRMRRAAEHISGTYIKDENIKQQMDKAQNWLMAQPIERVEMSSFDGRKMIGHWYPCDGAKRIIIAMHGWRSSWCSDFAVIAEFWHTSGCSILFAEQRGQGESDGDYMGFGLVERYDCRAWVDWVNTNKGDALPIYLCGVSMGASTVLMAASLDMPENVHGIMADCGFTSLHDIWKHVSENNLHLSYGIMGKIADDICRRKISMSTNEYSTVEAMRENKIPVIFVHGTDDRFVPIEMTYKNYEACAAPKQLLTVPGAGHAMSYLTAAEQYEQASLDFWARFD